VRLIIAEKALAARRIADILGDRVPTQIKVGSLTVFDIGDDTLVVPLRGHILDVDYPREYNNWRSVNLHQLVDAPLKYVSSAEDITNALEKLAAKTDRVTIATDFDTEGESIGREALTVLNKSVKVDRARFSALTPEEVKAAFKTLTALDYNLADSADARREVDLVWGAVLTRFVSLASGRLGREFLSVGRVQTPTLALIVDREKERRAFKAEKYWLINALFYHVKEFEGSHKQGAFKERPDAVFEKVKDAKEGRVTLVEKKKKNLAPPTPFNTTEFLRSASVLGVSPSRAMSIAESLYQAGYISYPRTDNTVYPESIKIRDIVKKLAEHPEFKEHASKVLAQKSIVPTEGKKKTTDHPPIYPVELAAKAALDSFSWRVYELVVRRFLATLAPSCELDTVHVEIDVKGEPFVSNGQTIAIAGWKEFYPYSKTQEVDLPPLEKGDQVDVKSMNVEEKETQPPKLYSPSSLIKRMEELSLGTKATRPEIIQKLMNRQYITGSKSYEPTEVAFAVIDALEKFAPDIASPVMTSKLEGEMEEIGGGKKTKAGVVEESRRMLDRVLKEMVDSHDKISASLRTASTNAYIAGKCPLCGSDLRMIVSRKTKKRFVGCSLYPKCTQSYPLPQQGRIDFTDRVCDSCKAPVIQVMGKGRRYEMCLTMDCETKKDWKKKPAPAAEEKPAAKKPAKPRVRKAGAKPRVKKVVTK
jgi:DNA topoisomerase-1